MEYVGWDVHLYTSTLHVLDRCGGDLKTVTVQSGWQNVVGHPGHLRPSGLSPCVWTMNHAEHRLIRQRLRPVSRWSFNSRANPNMADRARRNAASTDPDSLASDRVNGAARPMRSSNIQPNRRKAVGAAQASRYTGSLIARDGPGCRSTGTSRIIEIE